MKQNKMMCYCKSFLSLESYKRKNEMEKKKRKKERIKMKWKKEGKGILVNPCNEIYRLLGLRTRLGRKKGKTEEENEGRMKEG
jgi:hypothetical protein